MTLASGTHLGPYEILSQVGAGGMGEVYRAKDTRLDRTVAIKVLPAHLSSHSDLKQRFEREARTISSLSHPHICSLFDIGHQDGIDYLVMEFLEGQTLAERLRKGPLPMELLLRFGIQIGDALDKAHHQGIIHRDLKPANIMITKSGVKLLDFGLAKFQVNETLLSGVSVLPTEQQELTAEGTILGTIQYMSPEQLEGKNADARTDIFAMGLVLYEVSTGRKAFTGKSQASLIAAILSSEPQSISQLQPLAPPVFERIVKTCLAKDPEDRWQTAHDVMLELKWISEGVSSSSISPVTSSIRKSRERLAWGTVLLAILGVLVLGLAYFRITGTKQPSMRFQIQPPENTRFNVSSEGGPAVLSPDGHAISFLSVDPTGGGHLWIQKVGSTSAKPLAGTEWATYPFWSGDSKSIGFIANGKLKIVDSNGGPTLTLCPARSSRGGTWVGDVILFAPETTGPIYRVSAKGGEPQQVTRIDTSKHSTHRWPFLLPDGKHFLYLAASHQRNAEHDGIYFASLDSEENHLVVRTNSNAIFVSNTLLYLRNNDLMAQKFDLNKGELKGEPTLITQNVHFDEATWCGYFSASQNDRLVFQTRQETGALAPSKLVWFDRTGKDLGAIAEKDVYGMAALSPDEKKIAVQIGDPGDVWIYDLTRQFRLPLVQTPKDEKGAVWSPDGKYVAYIVGMPGKSPQSIDMRSSSLSGEEKVLFKTSQYASPDDWSPDGKFLLITKADSDIPPFVKESDIFVLPLNGNHTPIPFLTGPSVEFMPRFSPDGKWVAYTSMTPGISSPQIYVVPFDPVNLQQEKKSIWQISFNGGFLPRWRSDGQEIFYLSPGRNLTSATVELLPNHVEVRSTQVLFKTNQKIEDPFFSVSKDGKRFLINTLESDKVVPITLILNWTADFKK
jgi:eukaryotic-like serine/threonine-protein kinase